MTVAADLVARLAQEGIDPNLLAQVAQELFAGEIERKALSERRKNERDRKAGQRAKSRDVTGHAGKSKDTLPNDKDILTPPGTDSTNEASASLPSRQPVSEALAVWNENAVAVGWPQAQTLSGNRNKLLSARLREHGLEGWQAAIAKARASPYLSGSDPPSWFTFPWLIKSENFLKLIEGNYDRRRDNSDNRSLTAIALERIGALQH